MSGYINTTQLNQNGAKLTPQLQQHITQIIEQAKHDIISPLMCLQLMCEGRESDPSKRKNKLKASKLVARINSIMNNIQPSIQLINNSSEFIQKILVTESVEKILAEKQYMYATSDIDFLFNFSDQTKNMLININLDAFERMLSNLLNNAAEACSGHGVVSINLAADNDLVYLSVEDNGIGMPDEVKNKILNNIAVTDNKPNGRGIGFAQIRETLAICAAQLDIESAPGVGTKVKLSFKND